MYIVTPYEQVKQIVQALHNKKAIDITVLEIGSLTPLGDYFVIASGASDPQVKALSEQVQGTLSKTQIHPKRVEGKSQAWVLIDYGDVIVHLFHKETREFYCLERLWADAKSVDIQTLLDE